MQMLRLIIASLDLLKCRLWKETRQHVNREENQKIGSPLWKNRKGWIERGSVSGSRDKDATRAVFAVKHEPLDWHVYCGSLDGREVVNRGVTSSPRSTVSSPRGTHACQTQVLFRQDERENRNKTETSFRFYLHINAKQMRRSKGYLPATDDCISAAHRGGL